MKNVNDIFKAINEKVIVGVITAVILAIIMALLSYFTGIFKNISKISFMENRLVSVENKLDGSDPNALISQQDFPGARFNREDGSITVSGGIIQFGTHVIDNSDHRKEEYTKVEFKTTFDDIPFVVATTHNEKKQVKMGYPIILDTDRSGFKCRVVDQSSNSYFPIQNVIINYVAFGIKKKD